MSSQLPNESWGNPDLINQLEREDRKEQLQAEENKAHKQYRIRLAMDLINQGYAVTSRKKLIVARINRSDWKEYMESKGLMADADCYRRSRFSDTLIVSPDLIDLIPNSSSDKCTYEYKEKIKQEG